MRIVLHKAIPEDDALRRQWNDLVQQMEQPEVFYTYEWALAVHQAYHSQIAPLLLLAYEKDSLVGLVALAADRSKEGNLFFLASTTADYCDFISPPTHREELVNAVFATLQEIQTPKLQLANLPADSATISAIKAAARAHNYKSFFRSAYFCSQVMLSTPEQKDSMKQALSRKQMVRRHMKGMGKIGPVEVRHLKSQEYVAAALPGFVIAHTARFLASGRIGNLARAERRFFLEQLTELLSKQGWINLSCLMIGEQPVAWNYGLEFGGSWFWYQPAFESSFQKYYPGLCLLAKIIEQACESPIVNRVDLGLGAEGYKDRVATDSRHTLHVTVTASNFACWKERTRYHAAAAIRSVPPLENWTRRCLSYATSLQKQLKMEGFLTCVRSRLQSLQRVLFDSSEVVFLEQPQDEFRNVKKIASDTNMLRPINLDMLAVAAMHYVDNEQSFAAYLLRAAKRLALGESQGFALVNTDGVPLHLCWVTSSWDFRAAGLNHPIKVPRPDSVLIFDCWTPLSIRGRGYYSQALSRLAFQLHKTGKSPWIFSETTNAPALAGAEKAGFVRSFSLTQKHVLFANWVVKLQVFASERPEIESFSAA